MNAPLLQDRYILVTIILVTIFDILVTDKKWVTENTIECQNIEIASNLNSRLISNINRLPYQFMWLVLPLVFLVPLQQQTCPQVFWFLISGSKSFSHFCSWLCCLLWFSWSSSIVLKSSIARSFLRVLLYLVPFQLRLYKL